MDIILNNMKGTKVDKLEAEFRRFGQIMSIRLVGAYALITFSNRERCTNVLTHNEGPPFLQCSASKQKDGYNEQIEPKRKEKAKAKVESEENKDELKDINTRLSSINVRELEKEHPLDEEEGLEGAVGGVCVAPSNERSNGNMCPVCKRPLPPELRKRHGYVRTQKGLYKSADQVWDDSKDNPQLVQGQDVADYDSIMQHPIEITKGVLIRNFPIYYLQCHIYKLCENYAEVLHVEMGNNGTPSEPPFAFAFVRTSSEAEELANNLKNLLHRGKILQAFVVEQFMNEKDKAAM